MSSNFLLPPEIAAYVDAHSEPVDDVLHALTKETAELGGVAAMQSAREVGGLLTMLGRLIGARRAIEVGTFTGYSAICIARALPSDGELLCCDVSEEWTAMAKRYWEQAGVTDRIELRIAPAADTLRSLSPEPPYDMAYIDADKPSYSTYVELLHPLLRPGGLIAVDNVLWSGSVADPSNTEDNTVAIRAFNDAVAEDDRWDCELLGIGDGLTLLRKR